MAAPPRAALMLLALLAAMLSAATGAWAKAPHAQRARHAPPAAPTTTLVSGGRQRVHAPRGTRWGANARGRTLAGPQPHPTPLPTRSRRAATHNTPTFPRQEPGGACEAAATGERSGLNMGANHRPLPRRPHPPAPATTPRRAAQGRYCHNSCYNAASCEGALDVKKGLLSDSGVSHQVVVLCSTGGSRLCCAVRGGAGLPRPPANPPPTATPPPCPLQGGGYRLRQAGLRRGDPLLVCHQGRPR